MSLGHQAGHILHYKLSLAYISEKYVSQWFKSFRMDYFVITFKQKMVLQIQAGKLLHDNHTKIEIMYQNHSRD